MKTVRVRMCLIAALLFVLAAALGMFMGIKASAERPVTVSGSSAFTTSANAQVWAHRVEKTDEEGNDESEYYTMFAFSADDDAVNYRRNLAYKWFYNAGDVDDTLRNEPKEGENGKWYFGDRSTEIDYDSSVTPEVGANGNWYVGETDTGIKAYHQDKAVMATGYFGMEIGFEEINFEKFTVTFETQQYNLTKDKKTTNYIIFMPAETEGKVCAVITDDGELAAKSAEEISASEKVPFSALTPLDPDHIVITLSDKETASPDEFKVNIFNAVEEGAEPSVYQNGEFKNVGKMYASYSASSTTPVIPLAFKADLADTPEEVHGRVRMVLYELNGQSFLLSSTSGHSISDAQTDSDGTVYYTGGQVNDNVAPVLCLDKGITYIKNGEELSFSYTPVDVLVQTPSKSMAYFMLDNSQADPGNSGFEPENPEAERLFVTVSSELDQYIYPHATSYLPTADNYAAANPYDEENLKPVAAVKIYLKMTDTTGTGGQSTYVFMDWFVEEEYLITVNGCNYIAVAEDKQGATYNYDGATVKDETGAEKTLSWEEIIADYQAKVDEAAKNVCAGKDDFYLPSVENLVSDNATLYKDMSFSIYYIANGTWSQNNNKAYNQLSIDLNAAGEYKFTVYAHDGSSNPMWYLKDGEKVEFETGDIQTWYKDEDGEGLRDVFPWFTFRAGIAEISVDDPGEQDTAYVGSSYTAKAFDVEGLSTTSTYTLYRFEKELYREAHGEYLSYEKFMNEKEQLFEEYDYFTNIPAASSLEEGSEDYEEFYKYQWNASSRSFVPQDENTFYLIRCTVTSSLQGNESKSGYMGISVSATPASIKGEDTWLKDNMTSIVLLCIAGAALVGIVLLLVIRPKDKGDVDVQYEAEVAAKSKKKNK